MIASTRDLAVLALALFLAFSPADAFGGGGPQGLAKVGILRTLARIDQSTVLDPPYVHHRGTPRSRRFYIDHDGTADEAPKRAVRRRPQGSRVSKKKEVVHAVDTLDDFESEVLGEKERMVVVRFHAPWCKTCKSIKVAYDRLAAANPGIKFVDVALTNKNPDLKESMDVKAVPFGHLYHPQAGLVETNPLDRRHLTSFKRVLASYQEGICELPEEGATKNPFED